MLSLSSTTPLIIHARITLLAKPWWALFHLYSWPWLPTHGFVCGPPLYMSIWHFLFFWLDFCLVIKLAWWLLHMLLSCPSHIGTALYTLFSLLVVLWLTLMFLLAGKASQWHTYIASAAHTRTTFRSYNINQRVAVKAILFLAALQYASLVRGVINQLCTYLDIQCLTVKKKKQ